jgi:hypothetical protein
MLAVTFFLELHDILRTTRISDPAPVRPRMEPEQHRGLRCMGLVRHHDSSGFGIFVKNSTWPQSAQTYGCIDNWKGALGMSLNMPLPQNGHRNGLTGVP